MADIVPSPQPSPAAGTTLPPPRVFVPKPAEPAPPSTIGVVGWLRSNLFSSVPNALLTLLGGYILYVVASALFGWAVIDAVWQAENRRDCLNQVGTSGACWPNITT